MDQADAQFHFVLNQSPNNIPALLGKSFSATILGIFIFQHVPKMHLFVDSSLVTGLGSKVEELYLSKNKTLVGWGGDFPGGPLVKNPPANAGSMGSIPGPGRFHMPWSN